ncbi:hypothetical protein BDZ89DRAFT_1140019 [Hymenopellis radicata]|nr:hypothetical protein BDZ89DRAFT_1140019 [Hymenopellis radicata]
MDLPWAQLTTLIITENFKGDLISSTPPRDIRPRGALSVVPLRALKSLDTASNAVINHLMVPRLEEARLGVDYPGDYDEGFLDSTIPSFYKLVLRSNCALTITSLRLRKIPVSDDLITLLSLTKNLATLEIRAKMSHFDTTPDAVSMKTIMTLVSMLQVTNPPFLPKLRHLSINLSKHLERRYFPYLEKQDELVKALQSRWNVGSGSGVEMLRTFRLGIFAQRLDDKDSAPSDSPLELDPETEEALQVLMNDGMKISIRVYSKFARHDAEHVRVNFGNM